MRPGEGVAQDSLQEMMASEDNIAESWALDPPADRVAVIGLRACTTARQCSAVVLPHQPRPLDLCRTARLCRSCNLSCLTTWTRRTCARSHSRTPSTCCAQPRGKTRHDDTRAAHPAAFVRIHIPPLYPFLASIHEN